MKIHIIRILGKNLPYLVIKAEEEEQLKREDVIKENPLDIEDIKRKYYHNII